MLYAVKKTNVQRADTQPQPVLSQNVTGSWMQLVGLFVCLLVSESGLRSRRSIAGGRLPCGSSWLQFRSSACREQTEVVRDGVVAFVRSLEPRKGRVPTMDRKAFRCVCAAHVKLGWASLRALVMWHPAAIASIEDAEAVQSECSRNPLLLHVQEAAANHVYDASTSCTVE